MKTNRRMSTPPRVRIWVMLCCLMLWNLPHDAFSEETSGELMVHLRNHPTNVEQSPYVVVQKVSTIWIKAQDGWFYPTESYGGSTTIGDPNASDLDVTYEHLGTAITSGVDTIAWGKYVVRIGSAITEEQPSLSNQSIYVYVDFSTNNYPSSGHNDIVLNYDFDTKILMMGDDELEEGDVVAEWNFLGAPEQQTDQFIPDTPKNFSLGVQSGQANSGSPKLSWSSNGENFPVRYRIHRRLDQSGSITQIDSITNTGQPDNTHVLAWVDADLAGAGAGNHLAEYYLKSKNPDHSIQYPPTSTLNIQWSYWGYGKGIASSGSFSPGLRSNYPNPFNPSTEIRFALSEPARVELVIYNMLGQAVRTLVNETRDQGEHAVVWDGRNDRGLAVTGGVYIYRLKTGHLLESRRMTLLK